MLTYFLLFLFTILFSAESDLKQSVLLFHLDETLNTLDMINKDGHLVDYKPLNQFLMSQNAYKIEKWSKFASETDVHNGIRFAHIYRVYFNDKAPPISEIKTKLEAAGAKVELK